MAKGGTGFGCSLFLVYKTELSAFPQKRTPPLLFQRCLASLLPFASFPFPSFWFSSPLPFSKTLPPSFSFPALPSVFKNSSPLFKNSLPFAAASKGSGAAACAWGAGDTKPGQPALLPTPEGLGQRHAHGGMVSTLFRGFFLFFFLFFIFGGSKNGLQGA